MPTQQGQRESKVSMLLRRVEERSDRLRTARKRLLQIESGLIGHEAHPSEAIPEQQEPPQNLLDGLLREASEDFKVLGDIEEILVHLEEELGGIPDPPESEGSSRLSPQELQRARELTEKE